MPFLHITTRIEGKQNDDLLFDFDENSFPTFLVLDHNGAVLARHRGRARLDAFRATLKKVDEAAELARKAQAGDKAAAIDYLLLRCELHAIDLADLEEALEGKSQTPAQRIRFASLAADAEVTDMKQVIERARYSRQALVDSGEMFWEYLEKGGVPLELSNRGVFWLAIGYYAAANGKQELFDRSLKALEPLEAQDGVVRYKLKDLKSQRPAGKDGD